MSQRKSTTKRGEKSRAELRKQPTRAQVDELARQIAAVLNNPLTPGCIYNPLAEGITDLYMPERYTDQPEYISDCLASFLGLDWREKGASR